MSHREFDREIPVQEQLQEVSLILLEALRRIHRDGPPPRPPRVAPPPAAPPPPGSVVHRPKRTLPKSRHARWKPGTREHQMKNLFLKRKRIPHKTLFWQDKLVSLDDAPSDELARATTIMHQPALDLDFREAFDHVMRALSPDERRVAILVAERGLTHAARVLGTTWRQIDNTLARARQVFENAGFGPDHPPRPVPSWGSA